MAPTEPLLVAVEDDSVDIQAMRRAFAKRGLLGRLRIFNDSLEAWDSIQAGLPQPYVLLLDLAMPRLDGLELLGRLRQDPALRGIDVYLVTTSRQPREVLRARQLDVKAFVSKEELGTDYTLLFDLLASHGHIPPQGMGASKP